MNGVKKKKKNSSGEMQKHRKQLERNGRKTMEKCGKSSRRLAATGHESIFMLEIFLLVYKCLRASCDQPRV